MKKKSRLLVMALPFMIIARLAEPQSASTGIRLVGSHQISVDNATHPHVESFLAVDPKDAQHLLATAIVIENGETHSYPYASFDGGKSWTRGRILGDASVPVPPGMEDVTSDIRFRVTKTQLDFTSHSYTVTLQIENQSGRALRGPLRAVMMHFLDSTDRGGGLKNLEVANADSGGRGTGATWTFEVPGGALAPGR